MEAELQPTQEVFQYLSPHRVLACRLCATGVPPSQLVSHLRTWHRGLNPLFRTPRLTAQWIREQLLPSLPSQPIDPYKEAVRPPPCSSLPLSPLKVFVGYGCSHCEYVCRGESDIRQHYNQTHAKVRRRRGGAYTTPGPARDQADQEHYGKQLPWQPVSYQRFFSAGGIKGNHSFRVQAAAAEEQETRPRGNKLEVRNQADYIASAVFTKLTRLETSQPVPGCSISAPTVKSLVSPWLERTRWLQYLDGADLHELAQLVQIECVAPEPTLAVLFGAIDRLTDAACRSLSEDRLNFFGQKKIASFLPQRSGYSAPLVYKLQQATYKAYKLTWKRLLAFVARTSTPDRPSQLQHRLTPQQAALYDSLSAEASRFALDPLIGTRRLDVACLDFCIALLNDQMHGNLFESSILSFLAVLGVDEGNNTFYEASNYTSKLSGFIKIAQLLVLQKAVLLAESGDCTDPIEPLDEMRERFMTVDNCSPISWCISLRSFGKKIRDSITSIGYVQWSEDGQTLSYCNIELQVPQFKDFVAQKVQQAQQQLESLFLLGPDEARVDIVPRVSLYKLRDNPAVTTFGWNFLHDERNQEHLPRHDDWLLGHVLGSERLQEQFCTLDHWDEVIWSIKSIKEYCKEVNDFLETLLLLIHITGGQPARGSEITSLQHLNTAFHRNVFVEDGLVAFVIAYHKGYTCTGSTKIIHRYLPYEVSELLVYYLWLILPFLQKLELLCPKPTKSQKSRWDRQSDLLVNSRSPFLLPEGTGVWPSSRLTNTLRRETGAICQTPLTISTYRHIAIALSRRHLSKGGFKRDYDVEETASDAQTTHTSWTAGRLYARGLEEAPGHVEARRAGFRALSRQWHAFLGFTQPRISVKRPLEDVNSSKPNTRKCL